MRRAIPTYYMQTKGVDFCGGYRINVYVYTHIIKMCTHTISIYIYVYIYMYIHSHIHKHIYTHIYIERERHIYIQK